jgi:uncharacterized protein YndB with AHSA1/START domain
LDWAFGGSVEGVEVLSPGRGEAVMALMMASPTTLKIHIEVPVEKVFDFFANPQNVLDWMAGKGQKFEVKEATVTPEGVGTTYRIVEKLGPVPIETTSRYTEFVRNERIVETISGHLSGRFIYTFEPEGSGMEFTLEHIPGDIGKVPIVGGALENFITHRHQKFVDDFKQHMEA